MGARRFPLTGYRKLLFALLLSAGAACAQTEKDLVVYLDSLERPTTPDKADFMRVVANFYGQDLHCKVYDYYRSGTRKMVGAYANKYTHSKTGPVMTYYENGKMQSQMIYERDIPKGKCYFWYENGGKKAECEFVSLRSGEAPVLRVNQFWSRIGIQRVVDGKGHFTDEDVTSFSEGELDRGLKHGQWWGTDYKDGFTFVETYKKGKLLSGVSTDSLQQTHPYNKIFVPAEPRKGFRHFDRYFQKALSAYNQSKGPRPYTTVGIGFTVGSDGQLTGLEMPEYEGAQADEAFLSEVFRNYGPWRPALSRGIATDTYLSVPISINR